MAEKPAKAPTVRHATPRRRAQLGRCPKCKAAVLAGYDDSGSLTRADPTPITRTAELELFLAGRKTLEVERGELVVRDRWRVRRPARRAVVPEHRCSQPVTSDRLVPVPPLPVIDPADDVCPF